MLALSSSSPPVLLAHPFSSLLVGTLLELHPRSRKPHSCTTSIYWPLPCGPLPSNTRQHSSKANAAMSMPSGSQDFCLSRSARRVGGAVRPVKKVISHLVLSPQTLVLYVVPYVRSPKNLRALGPLPILCLGHADTYTDTRPSPRWLTVPNLVALGQTVSACVRVPNKL